MTPAEIIAKHGNIWLTFDHMYKGRMCYITDRTEGGQYTLYAYDSGDNYRTTWLPRMQIQDVEWEEA